MKKKFIVGIVLFVVVLLIFLFLAFGRESGNNYVEDLRQLSQAEGILCDKICDGRSFMA